jgi:hypothetical protein
MEHTFLGDALTPPDLLERMGSPLHVGEYEWSKASLQPLTYDEVFQLTYAAQVEWGTQGTFESLDISRDPIIRRFLRIWLRQEEVHADLLVRFLDARGVAVGPLHQQSRHRRGARRGRILNQLAHGLVGNDFFAVHMAWGAVNELTTLRFYQQIRARTENTLLAQLLRDIIAQEALHYRFYQASAHNRLIDNTRAQRIVRFALTHLWSPVGVGLRSRSDAHYLLQSLFADEPETIRRMDATICSLPGLESLQLLTHELAQVS